MTSDPVTAVVFGELLHFNSLCIEVDLEAVSLGHRLEQSFTDETSGVPIFFYPSEMLRIPQRERSS